VRNFQPGGRLSGRGNNGAEEAPKLQEERMAEIKAERVARGHQRLTGPKGEVFEMKWDKSNWAVLNAKGEEIGRASNVAEGAVKAFGDGAVVAKPEPAPKAEKKEKPAAAPKAEKPKAEKKAARAGKAPAAAAAPASEPEAAQEQKPAAKPKETAPVTSFEQEGQTLNEQLQAIMDKEGLNSMNELGELLGVPRSTLVACAKSGEPTDKLRKALEAYTAK
jgi:hypothetical protein